MAQTAEASEPQPCIYGSAWVHQEIQPLPCSDRFLTRKQFEAEKVCHSRCVCRSCHNVWQAAATGSCQTCPWQLAVQLHRHTPPPPPPPPPLSDAMLPSESPILCRLQCYTKSAKAACCCSVSLWQLPTPGSFVQISGQQSVRHMSGQAAWKRARSSAQAASMRLMLTLTFRGAGLAFENQWSHHHVWCSLLPRRDLYAPPPPPHDII